MRRARWIGAAALVAVTAYVGLDVADVAPGVLTTDRPVTAPAGAPAPRAPGTAPATSATSPGAPPATAPGATARLDVADPTARPLSAASAGAPLPDPGALATGLAPLLDDSALGPRVGVSVRDGLTGRVLLDRAAAVPREPASTTKLLTAAAVASSLPMSGTFETSVVRGASAGELVLVAGGDTLLSPGAGEPWAVAGRAGLGDLADQVVARLRENPPVGGDGAALQVRLDEAGLAGPRIDPAWVPADVAAGYAGAVAPLGLTTHRPLPGRDVPSDPALATALAFRDALQRRGLEVAATVSRGAAPAGASRLGVVRSAPVADQLVLALTESDNSLSSALARLAARRAGVAATFPAVASWVSQRVGALGAPTQGLVVADPSGLAPGSRASADTLATLLVDASNGTIKDLGRVYADLPVAGLGGTLATRYLDGPQRGGAGLVRAKTGTLTGVSSLAGTVVDADGRLLVFAVLADAVPAGGTEQARAALDRVAAALAGCGCR